jgi:hypothetical protein
MHLIHPRDALEIMVHSLILWTKGNSIIHFDPLSVATAEAGLSHEPNKEIMQAIQIHTNCNYSTT